MSIPLTEIERINALLPTELFAGSKDWQVGSTADRVEWLLTMYASAKEEVERLLSALEAQPQQKPVAWCSQCGHKCPQTVNQEPVGWWDAKLGFFDEKHFDQLRPLYTSPPAQRKPLTDELENAFKDGWNAAKAAHGIKENT